MDKIYDETGVGVLGANTAFITSWTALVTVDAGDPGWYLIIINGSFTHESTRAYAQFRCSTPGSNGHAVLIHMHDYNWWTGFSNSAILYSSTGACYLQAAGQIDKIAMSSGSNISAVRVG